MNRHNKAVMALKLILFSIVCFFIGFFTVYGVASFIKPELIAPTKTEIRYIFDTSPIIQAEWV